MDSKDKLSFYEKLYNSEIDRREKINARLNIPLAIIVALISFIAYLLKGSTECIDGTICYLFWFIFVSGCFSLVVAIYFFRLCWFGHTDQLLPTATDINNYYDTLVMHYQPYEEAAKNTGEAFNNFLIKSYINYATVNAINNDRRTYNLYRTTVSITIATCLSFLAYIPLQYSSFFSDKPTTHNEETSMTNRQPPSPPPGPGPRNVKGEVPKQQAPIQKPQRTPPNGEKS